MARLLPQFLGTLLLAAAASAAVKPPDVALRAYFQAETARLAAETARRIEALPTAPDRAAARSELRRELLDMLGLWPLPARTPLNPTVTGTLERDDVVVERLHFQSMPGLYVTANLYRPRTREGRLPGVLYVCGHAQVMTNGVSCGNKTGYQHHGIWLARHGYVCLVIDTLQLGEIEGLHHGTYRLGQWWWNSRGYTPAGVEAWNSIRALDYLQSRPEVDPDRLGMTGRSGGGSYTWTTAAVDDRIKAAAPVAGITDLQNQVVDGAVEGHCDCMFFINTHRWDFGAVLALFAPRPLLIVNTDSDPIFPLDGVERLHAQARRIYQAMGVSTNLGLSIGPGPHEDTQDLQVPVLRWFNRHLKGEDPRIARAALKEIAPLDLRVFETLPTDQRNTEAQAWFGPATAQATGAELPPDAALARLRSRAFGGWPTTDASLDLVKTTDERRDGWRVRVWEFNSQEHVPLTLRVVHQGRHAPRNLVLRVEDATGWTVAAPRRANDSPVAWAVLEPRGIGAGAWSGDDRRHIQIRRRFMLLGQTVDGMRVWDIRRGVQALRQALPGVERIDVEARGDMGVNALLAVLFEPAVGGVRLRDLPSTLRDGGPDYLNILQVLDLPDAVQLARERGLTVITE